MMIQELNDDLVLEILNHDIIFWGQQFLLCHRISFHNDDTQIQMGLEALHLCVCVCVCKLSSSWMDEV